MVEAICGICGKNRRPESLTCPRCFEDYRGQAFTQGGITSLLDWAEEKVQGRIPNLQAKQGSLKDLRARLRTLSEEVGDETKHRLQIMLGGEQASKDQWSDMWNRLHQQIWTERKGNTLYAQIKQLEAEVAALGPMDVLLAEIARRKKAQQEDKTAERLIREVLPP